MSDHPELEDLARQLLEEDKSPEYVMQFLIDCMTMRVSYAEKHRTAVEILKKVSTKQ